MQPLSVLGTGATRLAETLVERLDGRIAVIERSASDGFDDDTIGSTADDAIGSTADDAIGFTADDAIGTTDGLAVGSETGDVTTSLRLFADGAWIGRGTVGGFDDLLDGLAADHDYLVATGYSRLRVPTVLLGDEIDETDVPGDVFAAASGPSDVDVDRLLTDLESAEPWITLPALIDRARDAPGAERSGAIATFTGRVRAHAGPNDERTTHLAFESYEPIAQERMETIAAELTKRDGVFEVLMHHRTGVIEDGEDIVFVVVLAGHRPEAFETVADGIDRLKDEVPIFKKETTEVEEFWVHQRE